jgi:hypothetical protein
MANSFQRFLCIGDGANERDEPQSNDYSFALAVPICGGDPQAAGDQVLKK